MANYQTVPGNNFSLSGGGSAETSTGSATYSGDNVFSGNVTLSALPTTDPVVAGRLWNNGGVVCVSTGS